MRTDRLHRRWSLEWRRGLALAAAGVLAAASALPAGGSDKTPPTASPRAVESNGRITLRPGGGLQDGFYPILQASHDQYALAPRGPGERVVIHKHRFRPKQERPADRFLVVAAAPAISLRLAAPPTWAASDSPEAHFRLALSPDCADSVSQWAAEHAAEEIALLIGGEVTTVHPGSTLASPGELQIPCSLKRPCRQLQKRLQGDVQDPRH